jgi:hypothetical protein
VALHFACILLIASATADAATSCRAVSGARTTPLVELYTSEGCDSCPPADRWLSAHFGREATADGPVALAFHVDYWDRLGWIDRFASHAYTERQYAAMQANGKTFVVTPQILLQGHEWTSGRATPEEALRRIGRGPPAASIELSATQDGNEISVTAAGRVADAALRGKSTISIAYADSGLVSEVKAGENKGVRLTHDHVVRALKSGAIGNEPFKTRFMVPAEAGATPTLVAFVQNAANGDVLQAVALPLASCR